MGEDLAELYVGSLHTVPGDAYRRSGRRDFLIRLSCLVTMSGGGASGGP